MSAKKILAASIAATIATASMFGSVMAEDATEAGQTAVVDIPDFTYGLSIWGTSDPHGYGVDKGCSWLQQVGGTFVEDFGAMDADSQVASCEKLINAGCDFIVFCAYSGESIVPSIATLCQDNEVYFAIWDTTITDEGIQALLDANPYYCGTTNEDGYTGGYNEVKTLSDQGADDFVFIKYADGVATCDDRLKGAEAAVDEFGLKEDYVMTLTSTDDIKKGVQDALTNYPDVNAVVALGGSTSYMAPMQEAIKAVDREGEIKTASFDFYDAMPDDLESGAASVVTGGHICTGFYSALMCLSRIMGTPVNPDNDQIIIPYITCSSADMMDDYNTYVVGDTAPYSAKDIQTLLGSDFDALQKYADNWSVDNAKNGTLMDIQ